MKNPSLKEYTNGEITVMWQPTVCHHSEICFHGLPEVFNPSERPWIDVERANTQAIREQVKQCPSGALTYFMNNQKEDEKMDDSKDTIVEIMTNGPLLVYGHLKVKDQDGNEEKRQKVTAFCRCGHSSNKPFCDGTHRKADFKG